MISIFQRAPLLLLVWAILFAGALALVYRREIRAVGHWLRGIVAGVRARPILSAAALAMSYAVLVGADKGGSTSSRIVQFLTALRSGQVVDDSGLVAKFAEAEAIRYFNLESSNVTAAALNSITGSVAQIQALGVTLTTTPYTVAYIAADFPRADPHQWTNHNIAATIQKTDMTGAVLRVWVWYSEQPFSAPNISFDASVAIDSWITLTSVTNSWPATEVVGGTACIRYDFLAPIGMVGVPLRPTYELAWGGYNPGDYLIVPSGGLLVSTNGVESLGYTGWVNAWPFPWGTNMQVRFVGGVAQECIYMGTNYAGRVDL